MTGPIQVFDVYDTKLCKQDTSFEWQNPCSVRPCTTAVLHMHICTPREFLPSVELYTANITGKKWPFP